MNFRGTFNTERFGKNLTYCEACTAGYYCHGTANTDPLPCTKGNYSRAGWAACELCKEGRYCDSDTTSHDSMWNDRICPAGLECPAGMDRVPDADNDNCRQGHYCPRGDISACPVPCPSGTFNEHVGLKQLSECQQCTAGEYCVTEGLNSTTGPCPPGYYCPLGTAEPDSYPCPIGFYRNSSARESFQDCTECLSGYFCDQEGLGQPKDCPEGYFCVTGSTFPQPCTLGTYGNSTNLRRSTDCTPCPGGRYCDGLGRTEPTGPCDAGFYCTEKSYTSAPFGSEIGGLCPVGGYCPTGSAWMSPCSPGYYSPAQGGKSEFNCYPCPPGYFCAGGESGAGEDGDTSAYMDVCSAGYYCTGGSSVPTQYDTPQGHYSETGAFRATPCPKSTYQNAMRSSTCIDCPQGYYCNMTGTVDPIICPEGHYCEKKTDQPTPCPRGMFLKDVGGSEEIHCDPCTEGFACESVGISDPYTECAAGYYCMAGSNTSHPVGMPFGDICPAGYYCELGTANYINSPCPNGTYSNTTALESADNCTLCDPGLVCSGLALHEPNGICAAGYFCRMGAFTDKPADAGVTGDPCTMGHHCPLGSGNKTNLSSYI